MKLFCSNGLRHFVWTLFELVVVVLGTMMLAQTASMTTLEVVPSSSPLAAKTEVTLTAMVVAPSEGTAISPGIVKFCDTTAPHCVGVAVLGAAQLMSSGQAVLRFVPGSESRSYQAVFTGTATHSTSSSTVHALTVLPAMPYTTTSIVASGGVG